MRIGNEVRSHARAAASKAAAAALAMTLATGLAPQSSYAEIPAEFAGGGHYSVAPESPSAGDQSQTQESESAPSIAGAPLAAALVAGQTSVVRGDVALAPLDAEAQAVVGSFTADGLTFAIDGEGQVALVAAAPPEGAGADAGAGGSSALVEGANAVDDATLDLPATISHDGIDYVLTRIAPLAFDGAGISAVSVPDTVSAIDPSAALGCELLAEVAVSEANPFFSAFDGYLTDKALTSILLVPEGRIGQVRIPSTMTTIDPRVFSHCARIDEFVVDADCPGLASWNGSIYTKGLAELVRVPAGATELALPSECTAIGPSALSGCTELRSIEALGTVASIAPSAFGEIEEVETLPSAALAAADEGDASERHVQVTGLVAVASNALSSTQVDKSTITVTVPEGSDVSAWEAAGLTVGAAVASVQAADGYDASYRVAVNPNGHVLRVVVGSYTIDPAYAAQGGWTDSGEYDANTEVYPTGEFWAVTGTTRPYSRNPEPAIVVATRPGNRPTGYDLWTGRAYFGGTTGWTLRGFATSPTGSPMTSTGEQRSNATLYAIWRANAYTISLNVQGGSVSPSSVAATYDQDATLPAPVRTGYRFLGWNTAADGSGTTYQAGAVRNLTSTDKATVTLYAQWEPIDYDLGFNVDSEPGDADYPGDPKDDQAVNVESGVVTIEDPKRPGYVFEGWVIPSAGGTEAVDQDLVYQGDDGKWYVDASKLPGYAGDDGRVELTARWTSAISVDVPSSVTFYADLVTQGQESREGAADGAFGQSKVANQSQVDLRVVGLESSAVKTEGSTLGADSVLKKADAATPSSSTQKLLSLYPSTKQWKPEDLQDPDAVGGDKAATAVDFDLDDILLERSFKADDFTIAAGGTLNMGYRLNLSETGQQLDYDKLATLQEGQSASIANVSYCFAAEQATDPRPSGGEDSPLYVTVDGAFIMDNGLLGKAGAGTYGLSDIKAAADDLSAHGDNPTQSAYWPLYKALLDKQVMSSGTPGVGPYFQLKVDAVYLPLQLIGICQDTKSSGGKAGLTFQMRDMYAYDNARSTAAGGGTFGYTYMNPSDNVTNVGGWESSAMRSTLRSIFWGYLPAEIQAAITPVGKFQQLNGGSTASYLQKTTNEAVWLPSAYEVYGVAIANINGSEGLTTVSGYVPFQYMAYQPGGIGDVNTRAIKTHDGNARNWWLRSVHQYQVHDFCIVGQNGSRYNLTATYALGVAPCFCL